MVLEIVCLVKYGGKQDRYASEFVTQCVRWKAIREACKRRRTHNADAPQGGNLLFCTFTFEHWGTQENIRRDLLRRPVHTAGGKGIPCGKSLSGKQFHVCDQGSGPRHCTKELDQGFGPRRWTKAQKQGTGTSLCRYFFKSLLHRFNIALALVLRFFQFSL